MPRAYFSAALSSVGYFEKNPTLAIAVSGGADSMALLLLTDAWARIQKGRVIALTVDHGLRKESAAEARQVGKWCKARGIEHHTLRWEAKKPASGIQAKARDARYALFTAWCRKHRVLHLLTAHHLNDQAETLLLRLSRGSFIEGLASIPAVSVRGGVRLIRPLLNVSKQSLEDFLVAEKQPWVEDPSNQNMRYTRNALRQHLSATNAMQAGALAGRFGIIRHRLEHTLAATMVHTVSLFPEGYATLKVAPFKKLPQEQAVRLLSALVSTLGNLSLPPRTEQVRKLHAELTAKAPPKRRSLAHCRFYHQPEFSCFRVESPLMIPHIPLAGGKRLKTRAGAGFKPAKPLAGAAFLGLNKG